MATALNIRNSRAHELASQLAALRGTSITDAVIGALEAELEREKLPLWARLKALSERALAQAGPGGRDVTEEERDAMWTR